MSRNKRIDIRLSVSVDDNVAIEAIDFVKNEFHSKTEVKTNAPLRTLMLLYPYVLLRKLELDSESNSGFEQTKDLISRMEIDTKVLVRSFVERQKRHLNDLEILLNDDIIRSMVVDKLGSLGINDKKVTITSSNSSNTEKSGYIAAMDITNSIVKASANEKPLPKPELKVEAQHGKAKLTDAPKQPQEAELANSAVDSIDDDDSEDSDGVIPDYFG
jgi:hypothetical protein